MAVGAAEHVQLRDQLHVLAHRVQVVAAARDGQVLAEQAERPRDDQVTICLLYTSRCV